MLSNSKYIVPLPRTSIVVYLSDANAIEGFTMQPPKVGSHSPRIPKILTFLKNTRNFLKLRNLTEAKTKLTNMYLAC